MTLLKKQKYAAISNAAMRDKRLSIEARGLLALLMTFSDGWEFQAEHIRQVCDVGRDRFQRMMGELRTYGYLTTRARRGRDGSLSGHIWVVTDDLSETRISRAPENPGLGEVGSHKEDQKGRIPSKEENQSLKLPEPEGLITLDELWKIYPHPKNRGAKPDAAFKKLKKDEREKFRDAIPAMKAKLEADHARGFDRQAPMFATYLNQRRFMTELEGDDAPAAGRRDRRYLTGETLRIDGE